MQLCICLSDVPCPPFMPVDAMAQHCWRQTVIYYHHQSKYFGPPCRKLVRPRTSSFLPSIRLLCAGRTPRSYLFVFLSMQCCSSPLYILSTTISSFSHQLQSPVNESTFAHHLSLHLLFAADRADPCFLSRKPA